ncbi:MAG: hypothetical protein ACRCTY_08595, partial [Candidatus Adiutrix sp.]
MFIALPLIAQTPELQTNPSPTDHTITLTKRVEVYEDLEITINPYTVAPGDSLTRILKAQGLLPKGADEAQLLRLVRHLNPN